MACCDESNDICVPVEPSVFAWPASYYTQAKRHWEYGELQLTNSTLCFYNHLTIPQKVTTPAAKAKSLQHMIKLDNIAEIKKSLSSYFFKCLIVVTKDGVQHWIGSLPGRDGAYNTLVHFWRERLLVGGSSRREEIERHSKLGNELLSLAHESNSTLQKASKALSDQGSQLLHARSLMFDLHEDLDVAECLTTNLESWFGHWGISERNLPMEPIELVNTNGIPIIHEFPILYHTGNDGVHRPQYEQGPTILNRLHLSPRRLPSIEEENGFLRISREGMTILRSDHTTEHNFRIRDTSAVSISSPWKMSIIKYNLGEADIVYRITSAQMVNILPVLHSVIPDKLQYESPLGPPVGDPIWPHPTQDTHFPTDYDTRCDSIVERLTANVPSNLDILNGSPRSCLARRSWAGVSNRRSIDSLSSSSSSAQVRFSEHKEIISDAEVNSLSDLLGEMKSMALDIHTETERQSETIDELTTSVDRANQRLKVENKRLARLL